MAGGWKLAIDFGTSNTAASHTSPRTGEVEPLALTHGGNLLVSAVYVEENGAIAVGAAAANRADADPSGFLAFPKRSVGSEVVMVRDRQVAVADVVAAVLRAAYRQALRKHGDVPPDVVVLTHPEAWSKYDLAMLKEAARRAGIAVDSVELLSEPRAAAFYYTNTNALAVGEHIGVFDFGGGTLDVAVLTRTPGGDFEVVAARGDNGLGGRNFDALIRRWVDEQLEEINPPLKEYLETAAAPSVLRALEASIRSAKEVLSEEPTATVSINAPSSNENLMLTREEFNQLAGGEVQRAVDLTRATLADAGLGHDGLKALYLTGGSSRVPLIHDSLGQIAEVATLDDPKTVVAQGALFGAMSGRATGRIPESAGQAVIGEAGAVGADHAGTSELAGMTIPGQVPPMATPGPNGPMPMGGREGQGMHQAMPSFAQPQHFADAPQSGPYPQYQQQVPQYGGGQQPQDNKHMANRSANQHGSMSGGTGGSGGSRGSRGGNSNIKLLAGGAVVLVLVLVLAAIIGNALGVFGGNEGGSGESPSAEPVGPGAEGIHAALPAEIQEATECTDEEVSTFSGKNVQGASCTIDNEVLQAGEGRSTYVFKAYADEVGAGSVVDNQRSRIDDPNALSTTSEMNSASGNYVGFMQEGTGYVSMIIVNEANHLVIDGIYPGSRENAEALWNKGGFANG